MGKKMFNYVIGNPPYQKESSSSVSKTNGQKPMTNIFQYFKMLRMNLPRIPLFLFIPEEDGYISLEKE